MDKEEKNLIGSIFNAKTITSAGGILIALVLVYFMGKTLTNELPHIQQAIEKQTEVMSGVLRENTKVIEGNTKVLESLERRINARN